MSQRTGSNLTPNCVSSTRHLLSSQVEIDLGLGSAIGKLAYLCQKKPEDETLQMTFDETRKIQNDLKVMHSAHNQLLSSLCSRLTDAALIIEDMLANYSDESATEKRMKQVDAICREICDTFESREKNCQAKLILLVDLVTRNEANELAGGYLVCDLSHFLYC